MARPPFQLDFESDESPSICRASCSWLLLLLACIGCARAASRQHASNRRRRRQHQRRRNRQRESPTGRPRRGWSPYPRWASRIGPRSKRTKDRHRRRRRPAAQQRRNRPRLLGRKSRLCISRTARCYRMRPVRAHSRGPHQHTRWQRHGHRHHVARSDSVQTSHLRTGCCLLDGCRSRRRILFSVLPPTTSSPTRPASPAASAAFSTCTICKT